MKKKGGGWIEWDRGVEKKSRISGRESFIAEAEIRKRKNASQAHVGN